MRKIIILVVALTTCSIAQITFLRYYDKTGNVSSVCETPDKGFIIRSFYNQKGYITKTNEYGDVQWRKTFDSYSAPDVILSTKGEVVVMYTWHTIAPENKRVIIRRMNVDGTFISQMLINEDLTGSFIRETSNAGFLILGTKWLKTNQDGEIIWSRSPELTTISSLACDKYNIIISSNSTITSLDTHGNTLWKKPLYNSGFNNLILSDNSIVISGHNYLSRLDPDGNTLLDKKVNGYYQICRKAESYFLADQGYLIKLNSTLDSLSSAALNLSFTPEILKCSSDGSFIMSGGSAWFVKTDQNGSYNKLLLKKPEALEKVIPGSVVEIQWESNFQGSVNLYYSMDKMKSWSVIQEGIANTGSYQWHVPDEYGDYHLKISSSDNHDNYASSGMFYVHCNNAVDSISINNIKMWMRNDGAWMVDRATEFSCLNWPQSTNLTAVCADGIQWTCRIDGRLYSNSTMFRTGLTSGKITDVGIADDSLSYKYNIWKIRKDWQDVQDTSLRLQLDYNYKFWPGESGAPYVDMDKDGKFTRGIDNPQFIGDEVLWFTANDLDTSKVRWVYGSDPVGLEVQTTVYALNRHDDLSDVIFKKFRLINCSGEHLHDMYFSYKSDPDIGYAADDFAGCDTTLDLGYMYNGDNYDEGSYKNNPAAVGYKLVQGPLIKSNTTDSARYNGRWVSSAKNLHMNSFNFYIGAHPIFDEIAYSKYESTAKLHYLHEGKTRWGDDVIDPVTGRVTKYVLPGDPVAAAGWYEGPGWPGGPYPDDRRIKVNSGPFTMAPGDTQEVVYAIILAAGNSNLESITELKRKAGIIQQFYDTQIITGIDEKRVQKLTYNLSQNYPNPFNPTTTINYSVPERTNVELSIYSVLGEKVTTLVNEEKLGGEYKVNFNALNIASGVYYYELKTKDYVSARKMLLVK